MYKCTRIWNPVSTHQERDQGFFENYLGLVQGEVVSPIIFLCMWMVLKWSSLKMVVFVYNFKNWIYFLFILVYVITWSVLSKSVQEHRQMLNTLYDHASNQCWEKQASNEHLFLETEGKCTIMT